MQVAHLAHELLLRLAHVEQRLSRLRIAEEDHKVDRMAIANGDAHLRIILEAADAGTVSRAWIDDDVRPPAGIDNNAFGWNDAHQRVIDGTLQTTTIDYGFVLKMEHGRQTLAR